MLAGVDIKHQTEQIVDTFPMVTVMLADIVGFTRLASEVRQARAQGLSRLTSRVQVSPSDLILILNNVFTEFDILAAKHGLEKIKVRTASVS